MENEKVIGPLLTDEEFFAEIDGSIAELKVVKELFANKDKAGAYLAFRDYVRSILDYDRFYSLPGRERNPKATESLIKAADTALAHYITVLGTPYQFGNVIDWEFNATPNGYKEWTWHLSYTYEILPLSRAYRATGEEKYAKEVVDMVLSWIRQALHPDYYTTSPYDTKTWRTIEAGVRMIHWSEAIYNIANSPAFTPEACVTIFKSIFEHGMRLSNKYTHGNWLFHELGGMSIICYIFPVFEKCGQWRDGIVSMVSSALNVQIHPDGSQYELAPGYHVGILNLVSNVVDIANAFGYDVTPVYNEKLRLSIDYFIKMRMADGYIPPINDSAKFPLSRVLSYAKRVATPEEIEFCRTDGNCEWTPDFLSVSLPYAGFTVFRTGWGKEDISAFFDAGKFGRDHFHEDKLNLLVYNSEKPLVYEAGTYAYDTSSMRRYATQTEGHNTVKINGLGQNRRCKHLWRDPLEHVKEPISLYESEKFDYTMGTYEGDYGIDEPKPLAKHTRRVLFLKKPAKGGALVIAIDDLSSDETNTYEVLWHINSEGETVFEGNKVTYPELSVFASGFDKLDFIKGYFTEEECKGYICTGTDLGNYYEAPELRFFKEGKNVRVATLIAPWSKDEVKVESFTVNEDEIVINYIGGETDSFNINELDKKL